MMTMMIMMTYISVKKKLSSSTSHRTDWMLDHIGMAVLAGNGVWWTAEIENVFAKIRTGNERAMKDYLVQQNSQLDALVMKVSDDRVSEVVICCCLMKNAAVFVICLEYLPINKIGTYNISNLVLI